MMIWFKTEYSSYKTYVARTHTIYGASKHYPSKFEFDYVLNFNSTDNGWVRNATIPVRMKLKEVN